MAPYAEYMIASEETEPTSGWNYRFLSGLEKDESGAETGQRIIDAYFEENGELVLVDYKTDAVEKAQDLIDRYRVQLDLYERALTQITGKNVKEKLIYSVSLKKTIPL